jgi:hypothetical protein
MPDREVLLQVIPKRRRQIPHLVERLRPARMHPMQNLARPIAALARARNQLLNLVERKVTEISACGQRQRFVRCQAIRIHGQ